MSLKALLPKHTSWEGRGQHALVINLAKNFFIPHAGNSYEPHFLRPKRLFWYSLASIAIKLVAIVFISFLPLYAWMTPDIMAEESAKIVALTNDLRLKSGLPVLTVNRKLSQAAELKNEDMLSAQYFAHINSTGQGLKYWLSSVGYDYLTAGENLAIGFSDAPGVVDAWQASPTHYKNLIGNFSETGVAVVIGNYKGQDTALVAQYLARPASVQREEVAVEPSAKKAKISDRAVASKKSSSTLSLSETASSTAVITSSTVLAAQISNNNVDLPPLEPVVLQSSAIDQYLLVKSHMIPDARWLFSFSSWYYKLLLSLALLALFLNIIIKIRKQNIKLIGSAAVFICLMAFLIII